MTFKNILFPMVSWPEPTLPATIGRVVDVAQRFDARVLGLCLQITPPPATGYAYTMPGVGTMIEAEEAKTEASARDILRDFIDQGQQHEARHEARLLECASLDGPDLVAETARAFDLTLLCVAEGSGVHREYVEAVAFGSGRPCLVIPETATETPVTFERALVAWDGGRPAARALADALPLLQRASQTIVLTVAGDKEAPPLAQDDLERYLSDHGVEAALEIVDADGRGAAAVIEEAAQAHRADFMVMGAFGHSRLRDFILGGVTRAVLAQPRRPVFLSH